MAEGQTSPEAQTVMARQVAAGQHGGVPSPAGIFPNARRRRAPHIDLNRVDREAAEENARRKARQSVESEKRERKRAAADEHFLDVESVTRATEQPPEPPAATEQQAPGPPSDMPAEQAPGPPASKQEVPAEDWGEEPPAPPAPKKAAKKRAAKKAANKK